MKTGIFSILPDKASDPAIVAKRAEGLGFASYFVPDHPILPVDYSVAYPGRAPGADSDPDYLWKMPDPLVSLARAGAVTENLLLGTGVLLVPERNPLHLAKEVASLDHYTDGRLLFGIGAGWNKEEAEILGCDFPHRWTHTKECVQVMKSCWTEEESSYSGKYFDVPPVKCFPKPARKPHPPILLPSIMMGGEWAKRVFHRIVEYGDGWLPVVKSVDQLVDGMNQIASIAKEKGRDPDEFEVIVLGAPGQWTTKSSHRELEKVGINHVVLWLQGSNLEEIDKELVSLSEELF